jgi:hypothetical protein
MTLPEEPTLLQTVLVNAPLKDDPERTWAFALFCGLFESNAHDDFIRLAKEKADDGIALADSLLDFATRRAEILDAKETLAKRLWTYFQVGQSLEPELDEGTQPGLTVPPEVLTGG